MMLTPSVSSLCLQLLSKAKKLSWNEGDVWSAEVDLPLGSLIEYKYAVVDEQVEHVTQQGFQQSHRAESLPPVFSRKNLSLVPPGGGAHALQSEGFERHREDLKICNISYVGLSQIVVYET